MGQLNLCVETIHYFEGINVTVLKQPMAINAIAMQMDRNVSLT